MLSTIIPARLILNAEGVPVSEVYGDIYYSMAGGPAQARHVFLAGNGLPERWCRQSDFTILETGFGLGLNFMATWQAWRDDPQRSRMLHFISIEKHPFSASDLAQAHAAWPEFIGLSAALCARWPPLIAGVHSVVFDDSGVTLTLIFGDALEALAQFDAAVDAFYLDGFSPAGNPEMWSPELCCELERLASPQATLATWSVAGQVRRALAGAGFAIEKRLGFAGKRQMLAGRFEA